MTSLAQLPHNWTAIAATRASTKWVQVWLLATLPQLQDQSLSAQAFAQAFTQELEGRQLTTLAKQKNYRSNVVQALKSFDPDHPAIALVSPTTEEYRTLNESQRSRLAQRETQFITSAQVEELVKRATELLESAEWSEVAAGLAVLTGRRISEILLSRFALKSDWSLRFSEMAKKQGTQGLTIEIPTLAPAQILLTAIQKLQENQKREALALDSRPDKSARLPIKGNQSGAVSRQCERHFADLVTPRTDREKLYTHVFRAVYATIAAHWFCPPTIPEHNFKAEVQGHFSLTAEGKKLPSFPARPNYDDYAIGTEDGNRDGRLGIKLGALPGLQVIEAFRKPEKQQVQVQEKSMDIATLDAGTLNALTYRAANLLSGSWTEQAIGLELLTGLRAEVLHTAEVEAISTYVLRVDEEEVETLVQQLQPTIAKFQQLQPDTDPSGLQAVVDRTFGDLAKLYRDDLPQVYAAILQSRRQKQQEQEHPPTASASEQTLEAPISPPPTQTMPQAQPKIRRPPLYEVDVEKLTALMLKRGITGSPSEVFHAAIEVLESEQLQQQQQQTVSEVAQTMNWFTSKVEKLEATIEHLQQERVQSQSQAGEAQVLAQLQQEKEQLQQELQQTRSRLAAIEKVFTRETIEQILVASPVQPLETRPQPEPRITTVPVTTDRVPVEPKVATAKPQRESGRLSREAGAEAANQKVDAIIQAIISWNTSQSDPQQCIRISHDPLRALGRLMGVNSQSRMQDGLARHQAVIDAMNSSVGLGTLHNRQVKGKQEILRSIARENLGLENWEEVEWS